MLRFLFAIFLVFFVVYLYLKFLLWVWSEIKRLFKINSEPYNSLVVLFFWPFILLEKAFSNNRLEKRNSRLVEQPNLVEKADTLELSSENEDLEKLKLVTNQLIAVQKHYKYTEIESYLSKVISLQKQVVELFYENPDKLTDSSKRIILYYTNSILNVLQQWLELRKQDKNAKVIPEGNQRVIELLIKWHELLEKIHSNFIAEKYALLDAEIQSLLNGLNLDK